MISVRAIEAAAGLLDAYFIPMAERVFGNAAIPMAERNAMVLARYLRSIRASTFNAKIMRREIGGALREAAEMDAACEALGRGRADPISAGAGWRHTRSGGREELRREPGGAGRCAMSKWLARALGSGPVAGGGHTPPIPASDLSVSASHRLRRGNT